MTEQPIRIGEAHELVLAGPFYQVWPSGIRDDRPLAQFQADETGLLHALQYFRHVEALAATSEPPDGPEASPRLVHLPRRAVRGGPTEQDEHPPHEGHAGIGASPEQTSYPGEVHAPRSGPEDAQLAPSSSPGAPHELHDAPPPPTAPAVAHTPAEVPTVIAVSSGIPSKLDASIEQPRDGSELTPGGYTHDVPLDSASQAEGADRTAAVPSHIPHAHIWAISAGLAILAATAAGVAYVATSHQTPGPTLAGCASIQLTSDASPPIYAGTEISYSLTTQCSAKVSVRLIPGRGNPSAQSGTAWSTVPNPFLQPPTWNEDTAGDAPGVYPYVAQMRVIGRRRVVTSSVVAFTIVPTPFDTGNPANNDSALASQLNNAHACEYLNYVLISATGCQAEALKVLNAARAGESLPPMTLPGNFWSLPYDEQQFILVDEERVSRNLPPIAGLTAQADGYAQKGAVAQSDPTGPTSADSWASNWAGGTSTVVDDFLYMYDDGYASDLNGAGGNADCVPGNTSGCWGHRENILTQWDTNAYAGDTVEMGAACVPWSSHGYPTLSCAMIFIATSNPQPYTYTWADALAAGA